MTVATIKILDHFAHTVRAVFVARLVESRQQIRKDGLQLCQVSLHEDFHPGVNVIVGRVLRVLTLAIEIQP